MKHHHHPSDPSAAQPAGSARRGRLRLLIGGTGAVAACVLAIAGCGGSASPAGHSSSAPASAPIVSADGVAAGAAQATGGAGQGSASSHGSAPAPSVVSTRTVTPGHTAQRPHAGAAPKITHGNPVHRPAPGTGGDAINDEHPSGKASAADSGKLGPANPCLVSRAQAETFTGTTVAAPKVAPLGPTCVYVAHGGKMVTLAVEQTVFSKLRPHVHKLSGYTIRGSRAYCGIYGSPNTYVLLPRDRVLVVSAPCDVGKRFATAALARLTA